MSEKNKLENLATVLREVRALLAIPNNDFAWSSWKDAESALRKMDDLISWVTSNSLPPLHDLEVLFAPTGPIQEVSFSSGWGQDFLQLAERFDAAAKDAYAA